jgi:simple sugar transport system substrate-binding protein
MLRRTLLKYSALTTGLLVGLSVAVVAAEMPAPLDNPGDVKIALVRYLSTGDFFQSYLSGVETQAAAIGLDLRIFDR